MRFQALHPAHGEKIDWARITHVRVRRGARGDTPQGQRVLDHIRSHADAAGVAPIARIEGGFPARKSDPNLTATMRYDLRHMANARNAGVSAENKGLLELGFLE